MNKILYTVAIIVSHFLLCWGTCLLAMAERGHSGVGGEAIVCGFIAVVGICNILKIWGEEKDETD